MKQIKFDRDRTHIILCSIWLIILVGAIISAVVTIQHVFAADTSDNDINNISDIEEEIIDSSIIQEEVLIEEILPTYADTKLLSSCGLTAEELAERLHSPLDQYASAFIEAEEETCVNAVFLSAVAALESGWGRSNVAKSKNNLYGWTTNSGSFMKFESKEACINFIATKFKELYLSPEGRYFRGYDVEDVNHYYNGRDVWAERVRNVMVMIGGDMYEG